MSRRAILIVSLCILAVAAVAVFPWALTPGGPERMLTEQLRRDYGLEVSIRGKSTLALLPVPRLKVGEIEIRGLDGRLSVKGATLRGNIGILGLLSGRTALSNLSLTNAHAVLDLRGTDNIFWAQKAARLQQRGFINSIGRFSVANSSLMILREKHPDIVIGNIDTRVDWPESTAASYLSGQAHWNGKTVTVTKAMLYPSALGSDKGSPFSLEASTPDDRLALSGTVHTDPAWNITFEGKSFLHSRSLNHLTEWANLPVPLSPLIEEFSIEGPLTTKRSLISWPAVSIALGDDRLEGSLSFRFDANGQTVSGTLAAESIDAGRYLSLVANLGADMSSPLVYGRFNRADIDLRLSAASCRIGTLSLSDVALGVIVKRDRLEASLGRASVDKGIIKARLLMTGAEANREIRLQGTIEDINLARTFTNSGKGTFLSGLARGNISLEGNGATLIDVLRGSHGRANLSVSNGSIGTIDIPTTLNRIAESGSDPAVTPVQGSTAFVTANLGIIVEAGIGFITDGIMRMDGAILTLNGDTSLADGVTNINATAIRTTDNGIRQLAIGVQGPWIAPVIVFKAQNKPQATDP